MSRAEYERAKNRRAPYEKPVAPSPTPV